jgi:hypothetical protein
MKVYITSIFNMIDGHSDIIYAGTSEENAIKAAGEDRRYISYHMEVWENGKCIEDKRIEK